MKNIIILTFTLIVAACTNISTIQDKDNVTLEFSVSNIEHAIATRAIEENYISNLRLLVFDEDGGFISSHQANYESPNYKVTLPQSDKKRVIHFIANHDWSEFKDEEYIYKSENEVIGNLESTDLRFWQRVELADGIGNSPLPSPIMMLRNMAKFTLVNYSSSLITNVKFALYNIASHGTVAPFNTKTYKFEDTITESSNSTYTNNTLLTTEPIYTFERKNSTATTDQTFIIIKGKYKGTKYFYKIDIVDKERNAYDITRNNWYIVNINRVNTEGYSTIDEAAHSPASNNITASVILQSYPTISDGENILHVDKTTVSFIDDNQQLLVGVSYKTVDGELKNEDIEVTLKQDADLPVVKGEIKFDQTTGTISALIENVPEDGVVYTATISVKAEDLSRTIILLLHKPHKFTNIAFTPDKVGEEQGAETTLKFTIPEDVEYLLPFNCYISTQYLSPEFGNIEVETANGTYRYKWRATETGEQSINFITNKLNSSEKVSIDADLFETGYATYKYLEKEQFTDVSLQPTPVKFGVGKKVTLKFSVPTAGEFEIYTNNLDPIVGEKTEDKYIYTATTAGEQEVQFKTNTRNSSEMIYLKATMYKDYSIKLKNPTVRIYGNLIYTSTVFVLKNKSINIVKGEDIIATTETDKEGYFSVDIEAEIGDEIYISYNRYRAFANIEGEETEMNLQLL